MMEGKTVEGVCKLLEKEGFDEEVVESFRGMSISLSLSSSLCLKIRRAGYSFGEAASKKTCFFISYTREWMVRLSVLRLGVLQAPIV